MSQSPSQSPSYADQAIQPVPIVRIEAAAPEPRNTTEKTDDSTASGAEHHGFACGAADLASTPGIPWERRPLSRRGILAWTIASMSALVALLTTVAVARSPHDPRATAATQLHGAEATDAAPAPANLPPKTTTEAHSPPIIPLEALPIDKAPTAPRHRAHARAARSVASPIAVKKAAPSKMMLTQRKTGTR
jgi:hypothetical protein